MSSKDDVLRLRCRWDLHDPSHPEKHYAIDIRNSLELSKRAGLVNMIEKCCCGEDMIVLKHSSDPWRRT